MIAFASQPDSGMGRAAAIAYAREAPTSQSITFLLKSPTPVS
jgi:hypothetical protein